MELSETKKLLYSKNQYNLDKGAGYRVGKDVDTLHIIKGLIPKTYKVILFLCYILH